jgi:hypothetical protein
MADEATEIEVVEGGKLTVDGVEYTLGAEDESGDVELTGPDDSRFDSLTVDKDFLEAILSHAPKYAAPTATGA